MSCDSAWLYEDQRVKAFSDIRILHGDTLTLTGRQLDYEAAQRRATLSGGVRLTDPGSTLDTDQLVYDLRERAATYAGGGTLISLRQGDTLTSRQGTYLTGQRRFIFSGDVRLRHPERSITADTLHYLTATATAEFHGPTEIAQADSRITCVAGTYDTRDRRARFTRRATITTDGQELSGDSVHYDGQAGIGLAWGDVVAVDTANGTTVLGDQGRHDQRSGHSFVTGRAQLLMRSGADTLFLHADTLFAAPDTKPDKRRITARRGVRLFRADLQGVCDTLVYTTADSLIRMIHRPVLWSGRDQVSARHIRIQLANGRVDRLFAEGDAFMAARVDSSHFDQVSGRTMTGFFANDELDRLLTEGNSRTLYHAQETRDSVKTVVGVNRADCARLLVRVRDGEVASVTFLTQPEAVLYPVDQVPMEDRMLPGFTWRADERPIDRYDILRRTQVQDSAP
jgi:lipopolysaccharide export system protein LptA/antitoxin (DNA-binding transcriptional repressor) of toxin-antitoxin stability system